MNSSSISPAASTTKWLEYALDHGPMRGIGPSREMLLEGRATTEQIRAVKERSKQLLKKALCSRSDWPRWRDIFFRSPPPSSIIAPVPSDQPLRSIREVLIDLATALPEPWSELLGRATITLEDLMSDAGRP